MFLDIQKFFVATGVSCMDMNWIHDIVQTASRLSPIGRIAARDELYQTPQYSENKRPISVLNLTGEANDGLEHFQHSRSSEPANTQRDSVLAVNQSRVFCSDAPGVASMNQHLGHDKRARNTQGEKTVRSVKPTFGSFGQFGGRFVPESMMDFLQKLELAFETIRMDPSFWTEYWAHQPSQPTPLLEAYNLTQLASGTEKYASAATIWLKRDDGTGDGSHKFRNIVGQLLLARRLGRRKVVTDCASAKHGIFTAKMCKRLGLECVITIGAADALAQVEGVHAMVILGARVLTAHPPSGKGTLRAAVTEAFRYLVSNYDSAYYLPSGPMGPAPLPDLSRFFLALLGDEVKVQMSEATGCRPDVLVAAVGSGSGAVGLFSTFATDSSVRLVGVEGAQAAVLSEGSPGVLHGARTLVLQDSDGQILDSRSISPDMNISAVGPEVAHWKSVGRMESVIATDEDAKVGLRLLEDYEGVRPGLDSSHAVGATMRIARELGPGKHVVMLVSGDDSGESIRARLFRQIPPADHTSI